MAVAATAFFVSVCSLFIYIYQSKLMAAQQQVAVWPYVQWSHSNVEESRRISTNLDQSRRISTNLDEYRLDAENQGVGPALVRKVAISFNGKPVRGNGELIRQIMGAGTELVWQNGGLEGTVMSPGEKKSFLIVPGKQAGKAFGDKLHAGTLSLEITYCSIYGRCWTSVGLGSKRAADDKNIDY